MDFLALSRLTEGAVRHGLIEKSAEDCRTKAELLAFLAEFEARKLYLPDGYHSMHAYCTGKLHYSEDVASKRIDVAKTARRFPAIFTAIAEGRLHLSGVLTLASHLTADNVDELLSAATHKTRREIEYLLACRNPLPDAPAEVTPMPLPSVAPAVTSPEVPGVAAELSAPGRINFTTPAPPEERPRVKPFSARRGPVKFMVDLELLERALDLAAPQVPSRDVGEVLNRALQDLVARLEKQKFATTEKPKRGNGSESADPRHVPADVRREVHARDGGRCTFVSDDGHRCDSRRVEFDHVVPVAKGGTSTLDNLRLRCRAHNQYAAEQTFGAGFMQEKRDRASARRANAQAAALERRRAEQREEAEALARARAECATPEEARAHLDRVWSLLDHAQGPNPHTFPESSP